MLNNFVYEQTTKIIFGRGKINEIGQIAKQYGKTALLVTTPASPATKSLYEKVKNQISEAGVKVIHFDGVVPNPTTESVNEGTKLAKDHKVEVVIGLGGVLQWIVLKQ